MIRKPSFLSKLGSDDGDYYGAEVSSTPANFEGQGQERHAHITTRKEDWQKLETEEPGELAVDVYQTPEAIVVKAFIAGVQPNTIDISLTREMITVSGERQDERESESEGYFQRELYWGSFSRTILLPEEIDVDMAEASEKNGVLIVRLPKINKKRETKLKVRSR